MSRLPRRLVRRFLALAPVVAALGGQALAAGSLRVPFLPHAGTTPAPSPSSRAQADGVAALRQAAAASGRPDLAARVGALLGAPDPPTPAPSRVGTSRSRDIDPPGHRASAGEVESDPTCSETRR